MDRQDLVDILQALDDRLTASLDVVVIGEAAMILRFGADRATRDIDVIVIGGDLSELRRAARAVADANNLPDTWLNDAAKGFSDILPPDFGHRLASLDFSLRHLRLYALGRPEQAAMKIIALREQDMEDLELLLPQLSDKEKTVLVGIMRHGGRFRPDWAQKMQYFLEEQGWRID